MGERAYTPITLTTYSWRRGQKVKGQPEVIGHECSACGVLVTDRYRHDTWHRANDGAADGGTS